MSLPIFRQQLARNLWLSALLGFVFTMLSAFAARFDSRALLVWFGDEDPFGPLFSVAVNSFWIFVVLCLTSLLRRSQPRHSKAVPIFLLLVQVLTGEFLSILLAGVWQSVHLGHWTNNLEPVGTTRLLVLTLAGQASAYWGMRLLFYRKRRTEA
jgi:hypothetical protein